MAEKKDNWQQKLEKERARARLLTVMTRHVGASRAIGMGELYSLIFGKEWRNRQNDTRALRKLITDARREGIPICSRCCGTGTYGYFLAAAGSEMTDYIERLVKQGLKKLVQAARLKKISLPELLGQMALEVESHG